MKKIFYLLLFLTVLPVCAGNPLDDADNAYMQEHYQKAAEIYESVLQQGSDADVYYNLGNTYYRLKDMGKAVLNYERALILEPDNEDVLYNLAICQSKLVDQFNKPSEMFFITWMKDFIYSKNADQWGFYGLVTLFLAVCLFFLYRFSNCMLLRKFGFFASLTFFLISVATNLSAAMAYTAFDGDCRAVILSISSLYKTSNDKDEPIRTLHPGTTIEIVQENSKGWCEVALPNGKKGWMMQNAVEKIKP